MLMRLSPLAIGGNGRLCCQPGGFAASLMQQQRDGLLNEQHTSKQEGSIADGSEGMAAAAAWDSVRDALLDASPCHWLILQGRTDRRKSISKRGEHSLAHKEDVALSVSSPIETAHSKRRGG